MISVFFLVSLLLLLHVPVCVAAEYYKYVDEKGSMAFTDDFTRVPENKRDKVQINKGWRSSSPPASGAEIERPDEEELNRWLRRYFEENQGARGSCPPETDEGIGEVLVYAWNNMARAMLTGKLEKALSYFSVSTRDEFRRRLPDYGGEYLRFLFESIDYLEIKQLSEGYADCGAIRKQGSQVYSSPVRFVKDPDCTWRIHGF